MKINVKEIDDITILYIEGNIDINSSEFIETVGNTLVDKSKDILCNFSEIDSVDQIGISIISIAYKNVLNHDGRIKFCNIPSHIKKLFSVVGLDRVLESYETEEQALESFKQDKELAKIIHERVRRKFKRISLKIAIEYKQKFAFSDTYYKGKALNISALGIFMTGERIFSVGEILSTRILLLPKPGIINVDTKVIWVSDQEIQPMESQGMGLEFYKISPKKQETIIDFIEKNCPSENT